MVQLPDTSAGNGRPTGTRPAWWVHGPLNENVEYNKTFNYE